MANPLTGIAQQLRLNFMKHETAEPMLYNLGLDLYNFDRSSHFTPYYTGALLQSSYPRLTKMGSGIGFIRQWNAPYLTRDLYQWGGHVPPERRYMGTMGLVPSGVPRWEEELTNIYRATIMSEIEQYADHWVRANFSGFNAVVHIGT